MPKLKPIRRRPSTRRPSEASTVAKNEALQLRPPPNAADLRPHFASMASDLLHFVTRRINELPPDNQVKHSIRLADVLLRHIPIEQDAPTTIDMSPIEDDDE
jgi:hypothetical protein